jgi:tape measure domain-containing protein|nr:MAG TPA: tail tape measure protein [Bacteriophage sp.]
MAGMKFNADIDLEKIVKLRKEIDKLKKSLIEIASVPNSDAAVKALEKQLASALKKLEKYKDKYVQTQQARIDQEKAASEQIKKQQKEIDSLVKKYEVLQKQIEKGTGRVPRSPKTYTDDQISVALKTQVQSIKEAREQLKVLRFAQANVTDQQERETGARTKLNIKIQENTRYLKLNSDAYTRQKMEIGNYEENIRRALDGTGQFNLSLSKMLGVIGGTAALKGLVTDMINVRGEFQKTSIAFETMLGSKEKADALMAQMVETAAKTPFDLQGVTSGAKQLLAYGTSADKVNETLVRLGNIASGLSIPLGELVYLYGTSMSQGRLFTQDVNQFMGRGIPLVAELSKELGKTESEIRKMVTEGKVGFPELQKVIENMTNEGGKFYNLMEMQSTTLSGQISNLGDAWDSMLNSIGEETQGIASMTISAVTSIIENYKEVGAIIASLVATYGTYKAAIVVVNMLERANIMILRQAVVEKKLAAAANIVLSNSMAIAAARGKIFATVQKNIISTFKGAGKALANPYVLFAAAVGTATYGLYKFYTRETEVEKMQKRYNETKEAAARREEQHKTKVEELIASIEDETKAEMERVGAIDILKKMYPGIIEKYIDEEGHLKNLIALKKELSEADATRKAEENKTELRSYDERIKNQKEYIERMRTNDQSAVDDEIAKLKRLEEEREVSRQKVASDYINKLIADSKSKSDEELKNTIDTYKKILSENVQGEWFSGSKDFKVGEIKQFVSALEDLQKARLNAVQNKEYWENKKKQAEDARDALDVSKKNSEEWNKYTKQIQEAQKQIDKYSDSKTNKSLSNSQKEADKRKKEQERLNEELLAIRRQNQQAEIDLMQEGTERKLKQIDLDYQKEIDAIKKQKASWESSQSGRLTDEQTNQLGIWASNAARNREKGITSTNNERLEADKKAWQEYFIQFGNYQEKRKNLIQKYDDEIAKLEEHSAERATKIAEKNQAIAQLDEQFGKSTHVMADLFEDASEKSVSSIQDIIDKYELLIKYMSGTDESVSLINLKSVGFTDKDIANLENGTINIKDITDAIKRLKEEVKGKSPWLSFFSDMKKGIDDIKNANGDTRKLGQGISTIGGAITEFSPAIKQFGSDISSIFGEDLNDEINNVIDGLSGLGQTAVGVGQIMSGDIAGGIMSAVSGVSQLVNAMGNLFGPDGTAYYEGVKEQLEAINEVYDRIIDKSKEDIVFGGGFASVQAATQAMDNYEKKVINLQKIAAASGRAGASWKSHSAEWHSNKNVGAIGGFEQMSDILGKSISSMTDLYSLSGDELFLIQSQMPEAWSLIDARIRENLDSIVACKDEANELRDALNQAMTGVDFDSFYNGFIDQLSDMDTSFEDMCDNFEDYLRKSIMAGLVASQYQGRINALYEQWSDAARSDSKITKNEADLLKEQYQQIVEDMMHDREEMFKTFGWDTSATSQESSKKGFATASQDSIDELNGRFTALQIAGEEIKNQNQLQTMSILELRADMLPIISNTTGIKDIASETRDLLRLSYEELTGIHDDTTSMNKSLKNIETDIAEVKRNTSKL